MGIPQFIEEGLATLSFEVEAELVTSGLCVAPLFAVAVEFGGVGAGSSWCLGARAELASYVVVVVFETAAAEHVAAEGA